MPRSAIKGGIGDKRQDSADLRRPQPEHAALLGFSPGHVRYKAIAHGPFATSRDAVCRL
jgi:hypothetical protein